MKRYKIIIEHITKKLPEIIYKIYGIIFKLNNKIILFNYFNLFNSK